MSDNYKKTFNLKRAKSPSSIQQAQHHDPSGSQKSATGSPATIESINSGTTVTTGFAVGPCKVIRVFNTDTAVQYLYIGTQSGAPAGAPDITTGLALAIKGFENFYLGEFQDASQAIWIKGSSANIQVTVFED